MHHTLPFRLDAAARRPKLSAFNARQEIVWFGFDGAFEEPGAAVVRIARTVPGMLGGGGIAAINGGVIAAGFDAALVLAGLGHYESDVVITLEMAVQFLALARVSEGLVFRAGVTRSARHFAFVDAELVDVLADATKPLATVRGMVAPRVANAG